MTATFAELGLSAKVLAAVEAAGYPNPTPIQAEAIPVAVTGRDVLGIAQTGTGKTASFVLPMITRLESGRARARMPRSLILAPTRELAAQCEQSFDKYGINHKLSVALLIGGVSMDDQVQKLDRGVDVLIATPGRLLDHFQRGRVMLMGVEILVIDEADRMLDMGFIPDIERICKLLPPKRQTLFFSATMPPEITRLVDQFLKDPARIEVAKPASVVTTITQRFRYCPEAEDWAKREVLRDLIKTLDVKNAIIFCNRKKDVAILLKSLTKHGFNAGALHGDMDQMSRMATLDKFRSGEITLLAASDVAARGLDIPDVSHVINFDVPWQPDDYVHRIGRTGRAGKEGFSATIVTPDDIKSMEAIAKLIGENTQWIGEAPDEETLAEGRSRKRGRGGKRAAPGRGGERPRGRSGGSGRPERRPFARPAREDGADAPIDGRESRERPVHAARAERDSHRHPEQRRREMEPRRADELHDERPQQHDDRGPRRVRPERSRPERNRPERNRPDRDRSERDRIDPGPSHLDRPDSRDQPDSRPQAAFPAEERRPARDHDRPRDPAEMVRARARDEQARQRRDQPRERGAHPADDGRRDSHREQGRREPAQRGQGRREQGGSTPVGLGDHVPAFLRRPVRAAAD